MIPAEADRRTTGSLSLSLSPDVLREAERVATQEGRTKSDLPGQVWHDDMQGLDQEDACGILLALGPGDLVKRLVSRKTGEWMYVFKPTVAGVVIYVKVVLRDDCVVISFHDEGGEGDESD